MNLMSRDFRGISSPGQKRAGLRYSTVPLTTVPLLAHGEQGLIVFGFLFGCVNAQLFRLLLICWWRRCVWDIQWVGPTRDELIVFIWREFCQAPLVTLVIVIVHVIVHDRLDISIAGTGRDPVFYMVFHVAEEAFLRRVVPAVALA